MSHMNQSTSGVEVASGTSIRRPLPRTSGLQTLNPRLLSGKVGMLSVLLMALSACGDDKPAGGNSGGRTNDAGRGGSGNMDSGGGGSGGGNGEAAAGGMLDGSGGNPTPGVDLWHRKATRGQVVDPGRFVSVESGAGRFPLVAGGKAAPLLVSADDFKGVTRVVSDLQSDIEKVTGIKPAVEEEAPEGSEEVVLIGTLGKSPQIDKLVADGKLDVSDVQGRWETFVITSVEGPMAGVERALVIVGSDQRGTIYGAYELSKQMGVSPWYWWDDIPVRPRKALYVNPGRHSQGEPAVQYRGFFLNDENPQTGRWARKMFGEGKAVVAKPTCTDDGECEYNDVSYPGGLTHEYWEKVFEVALRLRANYIWPAVWGRQFADDDELNLPTARDYGIVVGSSHEAPMMRGIEEWKIRVDATTRDGDTVKHQGTDPWGGTGEWAWTRNADALKAYWAEGIQRMVDVGVDGLVTVAMRGTGDVPSDETGKIDVLQEVIDAQREIIAEVTQQPVWKTPQVWTLYKEVQGYWDKGMRAPDDVTIVWCDDNWGNMRKLQAPNEPERSGGYGIYYHFDYVGMGRNYKWTDTNLLPNVWEQLNLVYSYAVDRVWVVNVGDMKGNEVPLEFFLDYAWNPERWPLERLPAWQQQWAETQFGPEEAQGIAEVLHEYSKLQSDRKPELTNRKISVDPEGDLSTGGGILFSDESKFRDNAGMLKPEEEWTYHDDNPFSLTTYRELETVASHWQQLAERTQQIQGRFLVQHPEYRDAFFQLVGYPVQASMHMYDLRLAEFKSILYAGQGRAATNDMAAKAQAAFEASQELASYYNNELAGGKWAEWQTQPYLGYGDCLREGNFVPAGVYGDRNSAIQNICPWQQPEADNSALEDAIFPPPSTLDVSKVAAVMGVAIDGTPVDTNGTTPSWTAGRTPALPTFSPYQSQPRQYVEIFNRGTGNFTFSLTVPSWITVSYTPNGGAINATTKEVRAEFQVDWTKVPAGTETADIVITSSLNGSVTVPIRLEVPEVPEEFAGFVESNGYVSIEADHFSRAVDTDAIWWQRVPDLGRTGSGMLPLPVNAPIQEPSADGDSPRLEYPVYLVNTGASSEITVLAYLSPRNNVQRSTAGGNALSTEGDGLKYAVSIDDGEPVIVDINTGSDDINLNRVWAWRTSDNINVTATKHAVSGPGEHTVKFWMVDPTVIVQKLVVDTGTGELGESYFGPPESFRKSN